MTTITFTEASTRELTISADVNADAGWYYTITTIPGIYAVECTTLQGIPCSLEDAYWVFVRVDAVCTGGYIPGHKGSNLADQKVGERMPFRFQAYGHAVRDSLKSEDSPYKIETPAIA